MVKVTSSEDPHRGSIFSPELPQERTRQLHCDEKTDFKVTEPISLIQKLGKRLGMVEARSFSLVVIESLLSFLYSSISLMSCVSLLEVMG
jgi:hypothetical protein